MSMAVGFGWMKNSALRFFEIAVKDKDETKYYGTVLGGYLITGVIFSTVVYLLWDNLVNPDARSIIPASIGLIWINGLLVTIESIQRAARKAVQFSLMWTLEAWLKLGVSIMLMLVFGKFTHNLLVGMLYGQGLVVAFSLLLLVRDLKINITLPNQRLITQMFMFGAPLVLVSLCQWTLTFIDRYMIIHFACNRVTENALQVVARYTAVFDIPQRGMELSIGLVMIAGYPFIIKAYEAGDFSRTKQLLMQLTATYNFLAIWAIVVLGGFSYFWIRVLSDPSKYIAAAPLLVVFALGDYLSGLTQYINKAYELKRVTYEILIIIVIVSSLKILTNFIVFPLVSNPDPALDRTDYASAVITVCSFGLYCLISFARCQRLWSFPFPVQDWLKSLFAGTVSIVLALLLHHEFAPWLRDTTYPLGQYAWWWVGISLLYLSLCRMLKESTMVRLTNAIGKRLIKAKSL